MYKIFNKAITFFTMPWKTSGIDCWSKNVGSGEDPEKYLPGRSPFAITFDLTLMPLNYILRKCNGGYKFNKSLEKINHLMYKDDIKLFPKNEKEWDTQIQTIRIYSQDIGIEFFKEKKCPANNKKGEEK